MRDATTVPQLLHLAEQDRRGYSVPIVLTRGGGSRTPAAVPGLMGPPSVIDIGNPPI